MDIIGFPMVDSRVYIFVQSELKRGDLKPLKYLDALSRAEQTRDFFVNVLQIDSKHVEVLFD